MTRGTEQEQLQCVPPVASSNWPLAFTTPNHAQWDLHLLYVEFGFLLTTLL